jgi:hypothetical protein
MIDVVSTRKAAKGRSKNKNKKNCKRSPLATLLGIGESPAASSQHHQTQRRQRKWVDELLCSALRQLLCLF